VRIPIAAFIAFAALVAAGACAAAQGDHWSVRASGRPGAPRATVSESDVGNARPDAGSPLQARAFAQRQRGRAELRVSADAASLAALRAPGVDASVELDRAADWLQRLAGTTPARVELTVVDDSAHHRVRRAHDGRDATVADLVVPLAADGAVRSTPSSRLGAALAIALHEASHALHDGIAHRGEQRDADEARASLVEACYLVDTLRPGDSLRLQPGREAQPGADFTEAHSLDGAREAMQELQRAAGGGVVAWNDPVAKLGVRALCAVRLAEP
jgi:hypothetical protein